MPATWPRVGTSSTAWLRWMSPTPASSCVFLWRMANLLSHSPLSSSLAWGGRSLAHPEVQAYRDWLGRLVIFKDVDVVTLIEPHPGEVAIPHIVRQANCKTVREISDEIRRIKNQSQKQPTARVAGIPGAKIAAVRSPALLLGFEEKSPPVQASRRHSGRHLDRDVCQRRGVGDQLPAHSYPGIDRGWDLPKARCARRGDRDP